MKKAKGPTMTEIAQPQEDYECFLIEVKKSEQESDLLDMNRMRPTKAEEKMIDKRISNQI